MRNLSYVGHCLTDKRIIGSPLKFFNRVWWKINVNEEKSKYVEFSAHLALKFIAKRILLHQNTRNTTRIYIKYM